MLEPQPPPEDQIAPEQRPRLGQPRRRAVSVAGLQRLLSQVLERRDSNVSGPLAPPRLQRLLMKVQSLGVGTQVAQHPAREVHRPAREPGYLPSLYHGGVP